MRNNEITRAMADLRQQTDAAFNGAEVDEHALANIGAVANHLSLHLREADEAEARAQSTVLATAVQVAQNILAKDLSEEFPDMWPVALRLRTMSDVAIRASRLHGVLSRVRDARPY